MAMVAATTQIQKILGNDKCCDCGAAAPVWASINLGILICVTCSGVHRKVGAHITQVKSLDLDDCWKGDALKFMLANGNEKVNAIYEAAVPIGYSRLTHKETRDDVRENWIRAKWERKEFLSTYERKMEELEGTKEGYLVKGSGKEKVKTWQRRWFVLNGVCLSYYKNPTDDVSKGVVSLHNAEILLIELAKGIHEWSFSIKTKDRTYYLSASSDREMFDWIHAMRGAVDRQRMAISTGGVSKTPKDLAHLEQYLSDNMSKLITGVLKQKGPLATREVGLFSTKWVWRWGLLINGALILVKAAEDFTVLNVVLLESSRIELVPQVEIRKEFCFVVRTYNRQIFLACDSAVVFDEWMTALNSSKHLPIPTVDKGF